MITLLWPEALLAYLLVPVLIAFYVWAMRRRAGSALRYPTLELAARAAAAGRPWRRHVPAMCYLLTLCAMIFAAARPIWPIPIPDNQAAVMLSLDVSGSMIATDVYPNRMAAAKKAATEFVRALPAGAKVGLVSFSTVATLIVPPTDDHDRVVGALGDLRPEAATAIGEGLLKAVYALPGRSGLDPAARPGAPPAVGVDPRRLPPAAVVLMSDGGNNTGTPPDTAAGIAHRLRVVVHTVGLGAPGGMSPDTGGGPDAEALDEHTLKRIAAATDGSYHRAASEEQLARAYTGLGRTVAWKRQPKEVSGVAAAASAVLLGVTLLASMLWRRLD